jgi:hypothetical protein
MELDRASVWTRRHDNGAVAVLRFVDGLWLLVDTLDPEAREFVLAPDADAGECADRVVHPGGCGGRCGEWTAGSDGDSQP